jgi:uncharacterized protein YwqG
MTNIVEEFRNKIKRKAIVLNVGGFRPPDNSFASWFGKVEFCAEGESWPYSNEMPMLPLAQINLNDLPYIPRRLEGLAFITVFVDAENLPVDTPNGEGWEIRAYKTIEELVPIDKPHISSHIKPFPMKAVEIDADYPCWEDIPVECPQQLEDQYYDLYENTSGFKFGGWPTLIQSEIFWAPWNKHPASPEYVFQIDTEDKAHWSWGDGGVGYFGLGTVEGKEKEWALAWQCY